MSVICETCDGCGYVVAAFPDPEQPDRRRWVKCPCADCGGYGIVHCCEGDREIDDGG